MSNDWNLHCVTCDAPGPFSDWNHGEPHLQEVRKALPVIAALAVFKDTWNGNLFSIRAEGAPGHSGDLVTFAAAHHAHDVRIKSEYGYYSGDCDEHVACKECGSRHRCALKENHEGPCSRTLP